MEIIEKVIIRNSIVYDFLGSLLRLNCSEQFERAKNDPVFGLRCAGDSKINDQIERARTGLNPSIKELMEKFFDWETSFGLCVIHDIATKEIDSINAFMDYLKNLPAKDLLNQFIYTGFGPEIEDSEEFSFEKIMEDEKEMLIFVSKSMLFPPKQKAVLFELISNPEKTKRDYIELLEWHYENFFREIEEETAKINIEAAEKLKKYLYAQGKNYLARLTSLYKIDNCLDNYDLLILAVSKFYETFSGISSKDEEKELLLIIGNTLVDIASKEENTLKKSSQLFGTLSDNTKIEILKLCSEEKMSVNQLARKLKLSSTEIGAHISRLSRCNLVKTEVTNEGFMIHSDKKEIMNLILKAIDSVIED